MVTIKETDNTAILKKMLEDIAAMEVYVGIPEESEPRAGEELSNAQLAFLHTHGARALSMRQEMKPELDAGAPYGVAYEMYVQAHGSPLWHIPPRPIIEPAIEAEGNKDVIAAELSNAAKAVLDEQPAEARQQLERAGMAAQVIVQNWFRDPRNEWSANAPATIEQKGSDRPLIDTGTLRKSITYVVKK